MELLGQLLHTNLGQAGKSVAYNGTTWVVVANTSSNLLVSTNRPASTWTLVGSVLAIQGGGATADCRLQFVGILLIHVSLL